MTPTYLFYDIETSGLNKCFDQVLQFAAIRTDLSLVELERHDILVKLNPDTIPAPQAILTHKLGIEQLKSGIPEYEAITEIHQLLNAPGTISVGYNSLSFDDEFLRFSFYRNLLPPYTHQYANKCSRMDLYPIVVLYRLFKPEVLSWPKIDGNLSLRLEHLNGVNQLAEGSAHEAMTDVLVTLELARRLFKERKMWDYACGFFDKKIDLERSGKLTYPFDKYPQALLVEGSFGARQSYQCPALGLGMHHHYKNQSLWLQLDSPELSFVTSDSIAEKTFVYRKRFGEPPILLPLTDHFSKHLSKERRETVAKNLLWLEKNPKIFAAIRQYHQEYKYPEIPNIDVDAALYQNGFLSDAEQIMCNRFHAATLAEKVVMIERFNNPELRTQAIRVLGRNYPDILPQELQSEFLAYLNRIYSGEEIRDYRNETHLSPHAVTEEIGQLKRNANISAIHLALLDELEDYCSRRL